MKKVLTNSILFKLTHLFFSSPKNCSSSVNFKKKKKWKLIFWQAENELLGNWPFEKSVFDKINQNAAIRKKMWRKKVSPICHILLT